MRLLSSLVLLVLIPVAARADAQDGSSDAYLRFVSTAPEFRPVRQSGFLDRTLEHVDLHALALSVDNRNR